MSKLRRIISVTDWGICWAPESTGRQWSDLSEHRQWLHGFQSCSPRTYHQSL